MEASINNRSAQKSRSRYGIILLVIAVLVVAAVILRQFELGTPHVPLGNVVEKVLDWAIIYLSPVLETIKLGLTRVGVLIENFLLWVPWPVWVVSVGLLGWKLVSLRTGLLVGGGLLLIQFVELWASAMSTVALVGTAMALTVIIAVPVGIIASRNDLLESILRPGLDAMQTVPGMVYLIPAVMLLGVGRVPAIAATLVFAIPPTIRLTNLGLRQVPLEVKEAALAFGASGWQLLIKVEMPMALRTIMAGVNQSTMMAMSMVIISAFIGAGGLGYNVLFALDRVRVGAGFEAGLAVLAIAIILDRLTQALGNIGHPVVERSE